jgi:ATP synthase protein I
MKRTVKPWREYGRYGSVGIELVLSIMLGWYVGHWLDGKIAGGHGWLTATGFVLGVYAGFRALFMAASYMQQDIERAERRERGDDPWGDGSDSDVPSPPGHSRPPSPPSPPDEVAPTSRPSSDANGDGEPHDRR